jgi:hypothetical protein
MVWWWRRRLCPGAVLVVLVAGAGVMSAAGQAGATPIAGEYVGMLGQLHLRLHLGVNAKGELRGTLDSLDQGAMGLECGEFAHLGDGLMFAVPVVHGTWKGTVSSDGKTLTGTWNQGAPLPLVFTRDTFVAAEKPSRVDGIWLGTLGSGTATMRMQLHVRSNKDGEEFCSDGLRACAVRGGQVFLRSSGGAWALGRDAGKRRELVDGDLGPGHGDGAELCAPGEGAGAGSPAGGSV